MCECYWPVKNDIVVLENFEIQLLSSSTSEKNQWIVRKIKLSSVKKSFFLMLSYE